MPGPDVLDLTRELLRIDTCNPPGRERPCARLLGRLLEDAGFAVAEYEFDDQRTSLVARLGSSGDGRALCFTGHLDTVGVGGGAAWTRDPFAGETHDGRLYGRGSTDMKGGVAAFVIVALRLARHLARSRGLVLVLTASEETGLVGAHHLAGLPHALGTAGAVVVGEPTGNEPYVGHPGVMRLHARAEGRAAHASTPARGVNAIYKLARAITVLEDLAQTPGRVADGVLSLNVGTCAGGVGANLVPDSAELALDVRLAAQQDPEAVVDRLRAALAAHVTLDAGATAPGVWTDPRDPWLRSVFELTGADPENARTLPFATDAAFLKPAYGDVPTVILGPGELTTLHTVDEYCHVARLERAVDIYEQLARRWCAL
jgi:succinyl-diaminopimelate desuccinylase